MLTRQRPLVVGGGIAEEGTGGPATTLAKTDLLTLLCQSGQVTDRLVSDQLWEEVTRPAQIFLPQTELWQTADRTRAIMGLNCELEAPLSQPQINTIVSEQLHHKRRSSSGHTPR